MPLIRYATSKADMEAVRGLFVEYQADIGVDLCFQGFRDELETLPGCYSRPAGRLLLAVDGQTLLGCIGLRPLGGTDCEMKRLYVRPEGRGTGLGRLLVTRVLDEARTIGYRRVLLDTLPSMSEAIALYRSLGFADTAPYCHNPIAGALYFALDLSPPDRQRLRAPGGIPGSSKAPPNCDPRLSMSTPPRDASTADREFVHSRLIDAPPERVFEAFADPARLARWWGPDGFSSTFETFDLKPGGQWRFVLHGPDGTDYPNENRFVEVVPARRVVVEHVSEDHHFVLAITFAGEDGRTRVGWRQVFDTAEHRDRLAPVVIDANEQNLSRLAAEVLAE